MQSARQHFDRKILAAIVALGVIFLAWVAWQVGVQTWIPVSVRFDDVTIAARVARSEQARVRGLSGTKNLSEGAGMLFVYEREDQWGIVMRDMRYAIDILWLDENKKVIHIVHRAEPSSYPKTVFKPKKPAKYVLELPAGAAREYGVTIGSRAEFEA